MATMTQEELKALAERQVRGWILPRHRPCVVALGEDEWTNDHSEPTAAIAIGSVVVYATVADQMAVTGKLIAVPGYAVCRAGEDPTAGLYAAGPRWPEAFGVATVEAAIAHAIGLWLTGAMTEQLLDDAAAREVLR